MPNYRFVEDQIRLLLYAQERNDERHQEQVGLHDLIDPLWFLVEGC